MSNNPYEPKDVAETVDQSIDMQDSPYGDAALRVRIDHNMTNHAPINDDVIARFEALREFAKTFSHAIVDLCPEGRDRSLALTATEDALMRAVAAIARNQEGLVAASAADDDTDTFTWGDDKTGNLGPEPAEIEAPPFESAADLEEQASAALTAVQYENKPKRATKKTRDGSN